MAAIDLEYAGLKSTYRRGVQDALKSIRNGSVEERELDKLHNFCMVALMLMTKVNKATWRNAEKMAELADLLQEAQTMKAENRNEHEHADQTDSRNNRHDGSHLAESGDGTVLGYTASVEQITDLPGSSDGGKGIKRTVYDLVCTSEDDARRQSQEAIRRDNLPSS